MPSIGERTEGFLTVSVLSFDQNMHMCLHKLPLRTADRRGVKERKKSFPSLGLKENGDPRKQAKVSV